MNINELTENPAFLFKESFVSEELGINPTWEKEIEAIVSVCSKEEFSTGIELLRLIEAASKATFISNDKHFVTALSNDKPICSELLGGILMCLVWLNTKKTFPKVILSSGLYFFTTPEGQITQINSNRKDTLPASQKFDLFNSEKTVQFNFVDLVKHYFEEVCSEYIKNENYDSLKKAQSYMITFDPREIKWYARRGLLLKRLGDFSGALSDLKRFLSFCTYEDAPVAVKNALIELEGLNATDNFSEYSIH
ncbi:MAG: tetratricopeptide repeat protein [Bdellovibrionales bacterium]